MRPVDTLFGHNYKKDFSTSNQHQPVGKGCISSISHFCNNEFGNKELCHSNFDTVHCLTKSTFATISRPTTRMTCFQEVT